MKQNGKGTKSQGSMLTLKEIKKEAVVQACFPVELSIMRRAVRYDFMFMFSFILY